MFEIYKLNQKLYRLYYSREQKEFLENIPDLEGHEWDGQLDYSIWSRGSRTMINQIREFIKEALIESQGKVCAYCGGRLDVTSGIQIEHIAPKGNGRYPQFMFHPTNLTLACSLCNGFEKKEKKEHFKTIGKLEENYEDCYFNIVHPYLDNPEDHYELGINHLGITIKSKTLKGQKSIAVFKLDEEPQTNARWKCFLEHRYNIDPRFKTLFDEVCSPLGT
jgi:uncharacterized protein (TIGR02646 family)